MSDNHVWHVYQPAGPRVMVSGVAIESISDGRLEVRDENDSVRVRFEQNGWLRVTEDVYKIEKTECIVCENSKIKQNV
jgi:hypothetical protein